MSRLLKRPGVDTTEALLNCWDCQTVSDLDAFSAPFGGRFLHVSTVTLRRSVAMLEARWSTGGGTKRSPKLHDMGRKWRRMSQKWSYGLEAQVSIDTYCRLSLSMPGEEESFGSEAERTGHLHRLCRSFGNLWLWYVMVNDELWRIRGGIHPLALASPKLSEHDFTSRTSCNRPKVSKHRFSGGPG